MVVFILTKDRKLNFVSDSGLKLLGVSRDDVDKGFDLFSLLTEKDKKTFEIDVENALNDKPTKGKSYRFRLKDDSTLPVLGFLSPNTEDNKTTGVLGVMMDVSEMKKMEKELLSAVINTEDRERKRFSADLHDSLGPLLSSIKLYLGGLTDANEKEKLEMLAYTEELIDESIKSVRTISNNIMPRTLSEEGFYASLRSFADKLEFTRAIQVNFGNKMPDKRYDSSTEVILYRIMQELINNTIKHAQADNIFINFKEVGNQLIIDYRDDGKGFNTNKTDLTGLGLKNIRDRVKSLNGNIVFSSKEGEGTEVHLKIDV
jgi:PAS domain S-box-containing protein